MAHVCIHTHIQTHMIVKCFLKKKKRIFCQRMHRPCPLCFQTPPQETGGWKEIRSGFRIPSSLPPLNHQSFCVWIRSLCLLWAHLLGKMETKFCWLLLWGALGSHIHHCVQARPWGSQGFEQCDSGWGLWLSVFSSLLLLIRTTWWESLHLP